MPLDFFRNSVDDQGFIRGAARLLWAGPTVAFPAKIGDVINMSTYDAQPNWNDLGATKTGISITVNNTEDAFDVDQMLGEIATLPNGWTASVTTQLAEMTVERLQVAWEGSAITVNAATGGASEKQMGYGMPQSYTRRRLAVLFPRASGYIRGFFFRKVQKAPAESSIAFNKTGDQQSVPVTFTALADASISDISQRFFMIYDQINPTPNIF